MEINLVHPSLNNFGGAERVCLEMIRSIRGSSHKVNLFTIDRVDWGLLRKHLGEHILPDEQFYLYEDYPNFRSSLLKWCFLTYSYLSILLRAKRRGTLTINNYGEIFPLIADLSYVHSIPLFSIYKQDVYNPYQVPFWKITSKLYFLLFCMLKKIVDQSVMITNSTYNAQIIERYTRREPMLIHPPVSRPPIDVETLEKENTVLTISRIRLVKNLLIIPWIAEKIKGDCRFLVMGRADLHSAAVLDEFLKRLRESRAGVNVEMTLNPVRARIDQALSTASVYLSTQPTEAFGIAMVEAMARGCVPVVPRAGGPWHDILDRRQGYYGFAYGSTGEAAELIDQVLSDEGLRREVAERAKKRSLDFEPGMFREKIRKLINSRRVRA